MIERLENRRLMSATAPVVVTSTTSTASVPSSAISPAGFVVPTPDATVTTTDTTIVVTAPNGSQFTSETVVAKSAVNYTDTAGNHFSDTGVSTVTTLEAGTGPASVSSTYIVETFTENGQVYLTLTARKTTAVDANGNTVVSNSSITFGGPDAAAAQANSGIGQTF